MDRNSHEYRQELQKMAEHVKGVQLQTQKVNGQMRIQGERIGVPLKGRTVMTAVYRTEKAHAPIVFAFHGGGFCFGGNCIEDRMYAALRDRLQANIVSVDYRKNTLYPAALDDCYEVIQRYIDAQIIDFNPEDISVFGSSAGANLAVAVSIRAWQENSFRIKRRLLNYPYLDCFTYPEDRASKVPCNILMDSYFMEAYAKPEDRKNPRVSPVYATEKDLDPETETLIVLADIDSLRPEGERFCRMLEQWGYPVTYSVAQGMAHGYFEYGFKELGGFVPPMIKAAAEDGTLYAACEQTMEKIEVFYQR